MKRLNLLVIILSVLFIFSSCGGETKESKPLALLNVENILLPSQLKNIVEIVPEDDGYVHLDYDEYNYPSLPITFKLLKKISTRSLTDSYGQLWIVGHAQDDKGRDINDLNPKNISSREWRTGDSMGREFKEFLEGEEGSTITLTFVGESNIELFEKDKGKINEGKKITENAVGKFTKFKLTFSRN